MHAYLVCFPCVEEALYFCHSVPSFQNGVFCLSLLSFWSDTHALAFFRVSTDGGGNDCMGVFDSSPHNGLIASFYLAAF